MNVDRLIDLLKLGSFEDQNIRVAIFDDQSRFVYISSPLIGFPQDYIGMTVYEYYKGHLIGEEAEKVKKAMAKAVAGESNKSLINFVNGLNRSEIQWDVEFNPFDDEDGKRYILSRISPREIQITPNSTNHFVRELVEQSSDIFTVFDEDFNVVYVSRVHAEWKGVKVLGSNVTDLLSGKDLEIFMDRAKRAKDQPGVFASDIMHFETAEDNEIVLESSMEYHQFGQIGCFYLDRSRDKTEEYQRKKEIESQKDAIDKMSKWTALGQMAANIAHEVNNPLAIIELQVQAIERRGEQISSKILMDKIRSIADQKNRIANIVSSLNIYSQDDRSQREATPLSSVVHDAIALFKTRFVDERLRIVFSNDSDSDIVNINSSEIIQVLINLLNNAYDAISEQTERWIELNLYDEEDYVLLDVLDSGHGIDKEVAKNIFNRFYTTKSKDKGTGLGLNISQEIIMDHGGNLQYDFTSEYTTFTISLPKLSLS